MPLSEQRARTVTKELLSFRGWDLRPVSSGGQLLEESEYRSYPALAHVFDQKSKTGPGIGKPDFLLIESPASLRPLIVIDTKPRTVDLTKSIKDTQHYGNALYESGKDALSVAVAGAEREICEVRVQRRINSHWEALTLHDRAIDWIPSPEQTRRILSLKGIIEVAPERPPDHVLAEQAMHLNEILRECKIKDEFRPIYAATFMLALWFGEVSTDSDVVLEQINTNAQRALRRAQKTELAQSLRVDSENENLAGRAWEIIDILKKLNIRSFLQEHDYLGQLYETFFRYTGGNTIGQYFTPRHIIDMMCELVEITPKDIVFDPACGTGGFLIGALRRMIRLQRLSYQDSIAKVRSNIYGMESEPATAALCITNMILRGDGKSGVIRADCFAKKNYPGIPTDIALLNPPFPHKKTDTPPEKFIDRALLSVRNKGVVASIIPYSLLVNVGDWHKRILRENRLLFVATMPPDLFNPYASFNTAVIMLQKGVRHSDNRVLFARLWNDGYKIKKSMRVPQDGSQIPAIIDAFNRKTEHPELTAYSHVTEDSKEWSPEAFIKGAVHTDEEFLAGFEEHVRAHAAFYIAHGHKILRHGEKVGITSAPRVFAKSTSLSLSGITMGLFKVSDYFDIELGGKDEIEDLGDDGNVPIVSTSEFNNGVTAWKRARFIYGPQVITVATDGSTCSSFVQEFPFYAFYKVAILRPKQKGVSIDALYYVAYLLKREKWRYVYARKFGKSRLSNTCLYGPLKDGKPDFQLMAKLPRRTAAFPLTRECS
ncbi:MAG: N-6 DNA methylase [Proteobacteria bacterium]|nr:N-6 DNA methylase [Pseudomonadota bacterium]